MTQTNANASAMIKSRLCGLQRRQLVARFTSVTTTRIGARTFFHSNAAEENMKYIPNVNKQKTTKISAFFS
uniref:Uncharacterized protein n=1 Tax=Mesocestoides corti TaxID=53468 RepID=A0A5K3F2Q6_MESCO